VGGLAPGCADCLLTSIGAGGDLGKLRSDCLGAGDGAEAEAYLYGGAYDTGILTSAPILAQDSLVLDSYLLRASVQYANVETPLGPVHVFCTHLASAIPQFEYRGDYASWEGEQARQIAQLLGYIGEKTGGTGPVVVLGDLNTGPANQAMGLVGEWPGHYARLIESGLSNPYLEQADVACTSCPESTFHSPDQSPQLIDHILIQRFDGAARVARFLTEPMAISLDSGQVQSHLSDHFGLVMTIGDQAQ
jgi:endonuclease/exonuclease/phosphatase family metal-dependent hydrolase